MHNPSFWTKSNFGEMPQPISRGFELQWQMGQETDIGIGFISQFTL